MFNRLLFQALGRKLRGSVLAAGLWSLMLILSNPSQAISDTGFSGTVTGAGGAGIANVQIYLFDEFGNNIEGQSATTATDGTYTFGGLDAGTYKVQFNNGTSAQLWYSNKYLFSQADVLTVTSNVMTTGINADFSGTWGIMAGTVTDAAGTTLSGIQVQLCDTSGVAVASIPAATTKSDGSYAISLVPSGTYTVKFSDSTNGHVDQWYSTYNFEFNSSYVNTVTVAAGATVTINGQMSVPTISGKVANLAGTGMADFRVYLLTSSFGLVTDINGKTVTDVVTKADGSYYFGGIPSGSYQLDFYDPNKVYTEQFISVTVTSSTTLVSNINAALVSTNKPTISAFSVPATSSSLTVSGITLTATGANGVTGYMITESSTAPLYTASGWSASAPTSYTATSEGNKTLYPWAKDANNLVSAVYGSPQTVTISLPANGTCGSANGGSFSVAPTTNLCSAGTASSVTGTGPWNWTCASTNGGSTASCSATLLTGTDSTPPTLVVSTLADASTTNNQVLNVSGTVTDADSGVQSLTVNGQTVTIASDGSFSSPVVLASGSNSIPIVATDNSNNTTTATRTITFSASAPLLTVSSPTDNSASNQSSITVSGTVDSTATSLTVNGSSIAISGGAYSTTVNLASGLNTISIVATTSGGTATAKRTVGYDGSRSNLAVTFPNRDIYTTQTGITLKGTVSSDVTGVTVTMNDQTYTPAISSDSFQQALSFSTAGTYAITVTAAGQNSTTTTVQRNVIFSTTAVKAGDGDGNGTVSIAEVQSAINMYLGLKQVQTCADQDNSDTVSISEVQKAINAYLGL